MSKPTLSSLQTQVTTLTTQFAALSARLDTLTTTPAPAPAPKKKRAKKERNPDAPKRAPGAYLLFCQAERAKTPDVKLLVKDLAERWNKLSADQKAAFKPAAEPDKPASKPTFQEAEEIAKKMNSSLAGKYLRYCVKNPTLDAKTAEARFRALSPEDKAKYNPYDSETDGSQLGSDNEYDTSDAE